MVIGIDSSILLGYYQAKAGLPVSTGSDASSATTKVAPTPPWRSTPTAKETSAAVTSALAGHKLIDENSAQLDLPGASSDYRKLFALYQGLGTLSDLANQIKTSGLTNTEKTRIQQTFTKGLAEVMNYVGSSKLDKVRLAQGTANTTEKSTLTVASETAVDKYVTPALGTSTSDALPALEGDVRFKIQVTRLKETFDVDVDLSAMPDQTRSIANVVNYINSQLAAAGVETRLGTQRIPGQPQEIKAGSQTVKLPAGPDQFAMTVKVGTSETVNFQPAETAGAVYLAQQAGDPDPDVNSKTNDSTIQQQLLKFQTDTQTVDGPLQTPGQANWVDGRISSQTLDANVKTVRAQAVGPDGALYMLADVTGKVNGQAIEGQQDVALLKYDSAGKLVYTRTLGAAGTATGLSLAVSDDGKVAIAGSVTGALAGAVEGALNSGTTGAYAGLTDSFVALYDDQGQELWTERRGARQEDEATQVAFGADGVVYVAGNSKSAMPGGGGALGDWDGYVEAFQTDAKGQPQTLFTQTFGTSGSDKVKGMVVDGDAMVTATVENGHAVLRRFDVSSGTPVEVASRDLGDLQGGDIAGLSIDNGQLVLAGTTAGALDAGAVTRGASGGTDAFALKVGADLSVGASDKIAYYGGGGNDRATALTVSNGQVWLAGVAGTDLPDQDPVGKQDGFLAQLDIDTGDVDWSRRFTATSQKAAPTSIAVASAGASVLDRLGLPTGKLSFDDTQQVTAVSSLRAGDNFTISTNGGAPSKVTIDANDTLDTLALKIRRASGYTVNVEIVSADGQRQLSLKPANSHAVIQFGAGKPGFDALPALGIPEGVLRATTTDGGKTVPADGKAQIYGLSLESDLNLSDDTQISHALAVLASAQGVIRDAYKDLVDAATPQAQKNAQAAAAATSGKVPTYMTDQIANYQAALDRLTGGSTSDSSSSGFSTLSLFGI